MLRGIGLVPNWQKKNTGQVVEKIKSFFTALDMLVYVAPERELLLSLPFPIAEFQSWNNKVDVVIVLGGDGTILRAAREFCTTTIPILGINLGRKGFLAEVELQDLQHSLENLVAGNYEISRRMMLQCQVKREGKHLGHFDCLNDIAITRGPFSRIIRLEAYINDVFLQCYPGDGIVISSPTGSTGYSLSAGGPVVNPSLEILAITPICPHLLYNRSVIVGGDDQVSLTVKTKNAQVCVTIDGQEGIPLEHNDVIEVKKAHHFAKLVSFPGENYYKLLHQKFIGG